MITIGTKYNILYILLYRWTSNKVVRFPFSDDCPFDFLKKQTAHNSWPDNNIIYPFADDLLDRDVGDRQRLDTVQPADRHTHTMEVLLPIYTTRRRGGRRQDEDNRFIFNQPFRPTYSIYVPPPTWPCYGGHKLYVLYYYYTYYI